MSKPHLIVVRAYCAYLDGKQVGDVKLNADGIARFEQMLHGVDIVQSRDMPTNIGRITATDPPFAIVQIWDQEKIKQLQPMQSHGYDLYTNSLVDGNDRPLLVKYGIVEPSPRNEQSMI